MHAEALPLQEVTVVNLGLLMFVLAQTQRTLHIREALRIL
jgi:hypothetical protein